MKRVVVNYRAALLIVPVLVAAVCIAKFSTTYAVIDGAVGLPIAALLLAEAVWWFARGALVLDGDALYVRDLLGRTVASYSASRRDFAIEGGKLYVTRDGKREQVPAWLADRGELAALAAHIGPDAPAVRDDELAPDVFDRAAAWLVAHGAVLAVGLVTVAVAFMHIHVFRGHPAGDDLTFHYAESARIADCISVGDFDFWNPSANGGYASLYYYQAVPQLISAIPAAIAGHHLFFFQLSVWLPHVIAPVLAYRGMRILGATPWQAALAAFVIAYMNGASKWGAGNAGTFNVGLYTQTWAFAGFPMALAHGARWIQDRRGLAPAVAWGAFVGLCHPIGVIVLGVGLVASVIAALVPRLEPLRWPSIVGRLAVFVGLFVLLVIPNLLDKKNPHAPAWGVICGVTLIVGGLALPLGARDGTRWVFPDWRRVGGELGRTVVLGVLMVIAWSPIWLPLKWPVVGSPFPDPAGFGGFPHRVPGEDGPGFFQLAAWYTNGEILDWMHGWRIAIFTWSLPLVVMTVRLPYLRWIWPPALLSALVLGIGPHIGKVDADDVFPAVRVLGPMQTLLALAIGAGVVVIIQRLWTAEPGSPAAKARRISLIGIALALITWLMLVVWFGKADSAPFRIAYRLTHGVLDGHRLTQVVYTLVVAVPLVWLVPLAWRTLDDPYAARTGLAAYAAAALVLVLIPGTEALSSRVRIMEDAKNNYASELFTVNKILAEQPQGRKQVGPGAENHWWNLLSYAEERVPSTLQMGGGGLQASPNYDFLWSKRDYTLDAWLYDAPYIVFMTNLGQRIPEGHTIARTENYEIRRLTTPGLVTPVQVTDVLPADKKEAHKKALEWLKTGEPMKDHVLAYAGFGGPGDPPAGRMIRAWHQDSPGNDADIVAEVEADKPSTFVIRESWHPRWHAYIDGVEAPVRRVTPDFPAVDVPVGKHTLELRFERPWWLLASWLLWPGIPLAAFLWERRRRKRENARLPEARTLNA